MERYGVIAMRRAIIWLCLLAVCATTSYAAGASTAGKDRVRLLFHCEGGSGNGIAMNEDWIALKRMVDALRPLQTRYDVYMIVDPMLADKRKFSRLLDILAARRMPFVFNVYTSDALMLGSCSVQNAPYDGSHGVSISIDDLSRYKRRYGKWLAGIRLHELFGEDFTVHAIRTTNPEWARPGVKLPTDDFFQTEIAEPFLRFAKGNGMFVHWSDWHWFEFASWDKPTQIREQKMSELLRRYPGLVTVTYANNEPNSDSAQRLGYWQKSVAGFVKDGAAGYGLSNQTWMRDDMTCPIEEIVDWTMSALNQGCKLIQLEPHWYYFRLPRGTFDVQYYTSDPAWTDRGKPTANFRRLEDALLSFEGSPAPKR